MIVDRIRPVAGLPFVLSDLKNHLRIDGNETDLEVQEHGRSAALELEAYAQVALLDQTVRVTLEGWPRTALFALPVAPMLDPLSVTITVDGQPFDAYAIIAGQRPAVRLTDHAKPCGVVVIEYVAGFGASPSDMPADLLNAIMDQACAFYDNRGEGDGKTNGMSPHMPRIAARYRRVAI